MDDSAIVEYCRKWKMHYSHVFPLVALNNDDFKWHYGVLVHLSQPLVTELTDRWLDSWPIQQLVHTDKPPLHSANTIELLSNSLSAVQVLLDVAKTNAPADKRQLVSLIHRFIYEVNRYLHAVDVVRDYASNHGPPLSLEDVQEMLQSFHAVPTPNQEFEAKRNSLLQKKLQAGRAFVETSPFLAAELVKHNFDPKKVLLIQSRGEEDGTNPQASEAVRSIWEDAKTDLREVLIRVSAFATVTTEDEVSSDISSDDLMTREEIAIAAMISAKTLANQKLLGAPAVQGAVEAKNLSGIIFTKNCLLNKGSEGVCLHSLMQSE